MPINYLAGTLTNDVYPGEIIASPTELLTKLRDSLTAGGQIVTDEIEASSRIITTGTDNGDSCTKIYSVTFESGINYSLNLQGDNTLREGGTLSPVLSIPFAANGNAKLYVVSDEGGECVSIINPGLASKTFHAGWLERRNKSDLGAWMIGYLNVWLTDSYFSTDIHGIEWAEAKRYYYSSNESFTAPVGPYHLLFDSGCASMVGAVATTVSNSKVNYKPWLGQTDSVTGTPILLPYGYLQGANTYNRYDHTDLSKGQGLYNPGFVRFARTGLAFLEAGAQCRAGTATFMSGGPSGVGAFQGFQISD